MDTLREKPRARKMVHQKMQKLTAPPLENEHVKDIMMDLNRREIGEVFDTLHRSEWKKDPTKMEENLHTAGLVLLDDGSYELAMDNTGKTKGQVYSNIQTVLRKVSDEPEARQRLIRFVTDIHRLREKHLPRLQEYWEKQEENELPDIRDLGHK